MCLTLNDWYFLPPAGSHHPCFHSSPKEEGAEDGLLFGDSRATSVSFLKLSGISRGQNSVRGNEVAFLCECIPTEKTVAFLHENDFSAVSFRVINTFVYTFCEQLLKCPLLLI